MNLYLVRHGQTEYNANKIVQGISDIPLNDVGKRQAEELKNDINSLDIDVVICSPLQRARETAEIILKNKDVKIIFDDRVIERDFGVLEGGDESFYDYVSYWDYKLDHDIGENVEKVSVLFDRVSGFLDDLKNKYKGKNVLIVSHGGVIRATHFIVSGFDEEDDLLEFFAPNCSILKYRM